jgi:hypothetical protein
VIRRIAVIILLVMPMAEFLDAADFKYQIERGVAISIEHSTVIRKTGPEIIFAVQGKQVPFDTQDKTDAGEYTDVFAGMEHIRAIASRYSEKYDIDTNLIMAVIQVESSFRVDAVSRAGARGLMQLMPETAKELGVADVFCPEQNIYGGVKYLAALMNLYDGDIGLVLAAYNAGIGNVTRFGNSIPPFPETMGFIERVLEIHRRAAG